MGAFFNPASIGAGPRPSAASGQRPQWQAFVNECQTATDTHILMVGAFVAGAILIAFGVPWAVKRFGREDNTVSLTSPGWYPDPTDPTLGRWWDGQAWGPSYAATPDHTSSLVSNP